MNTQNRRKFTRIGLLVTAAALVAGSAGGGALMTAQSTIAGNQWKTTASDASTVSITGHAFNVHLTPSNPSSTEDWVITNNSKTQAATVDGVFKMTDAPSANAADVDIAYGMDQSKTSVPSWQFVAGGTLAAPHSVDLASLMGKATLAPGESRTVRVKTTFKDPMTGADAIDRGDFALSYQFQN